MAETKLKKQPLAEGFSLEERLEKSAPKTEAPKYKSSKNPSNSVKAKQQSYTAFSGKLQREAKVMIKDSKEKMNAAVSKFNSEIEKQRTENEAVVRKIGSGVTKLQGKIKSFQGEIKSKHSSFKTYSKEFWG